MIDFEKDKTAQGIGAVLLAAAAWLFTKLRTTSKEERPLVNGQRLRYVEALRVLQKENEHLLERVVTLESESEDGRREHNRLYRELHNRIRDLESMLRTALGQHPAP